MALSSQLYFRSIQQSPLEINGSLTSAAGVIELDVGGRIIKIDSSAKSPDLNPMYLWCGACQVTCLIQVCLLCLPCQDGRSWSGRIAEYLSRDKRNVIRSMPIRVNVVIRNA